MTRLNGKLTWTVAALTLLAAIWNGANLYYANQREIAALQHHLDNLEQRVHDLEMRR